uniref:Sialin n=1 Tax=Cacopsylla melanoneura TaxID=428564 RepID=A0A8D8VRN9_9HEMI
MASEVGKDDRVYPMQGGDYPMFGARQSIRDMQVAVPARVVLYMMSFTGFLVSFMMRTDINIAMVAMVKFQSSGNSSANSSQPFCYTEPKITSPINGSEPPLYNETFVEKPNEEGEFDWDTTTQGAILSSFYWCYILSQVVGGVLTQRFGTKTVFGFSQLITAICSLLIPQAAVLHYGALIALRSIQGIASVSAPLFSRNMFPSYFSSPPLQTLALFSRNVLAVPGTNVACYVRSGWTLDSIQ